VAAIGRNGWRKRVEVAKQLVRAVDEIDVQAGDSRQQNISSGYNEAVRGGLTCEEERMSSRADALK
jgi:hypothetical protein